MTRPVDPRLWRHSWAARRYLVLSVVFSLLVTASIVVTAMTVAGVLSGLITGRRAGLTADLVALAVAVAVRVVATWWQARLAHRAGAQVTAELEAQVLATAVRLPDRELDWRRGELAVVATTGLAGLRPYLTGYLPALLLAVLVPPAVLAAIASRDLVSAGIIAATLPLIPAFMILIGLLSKGKADASLTAMTRLADQMLDLFAGLPTLRALGREHGPERRVAELGAAHRRTTMATLRVAFLSSMTLELLATICVALVAVSIGLRLVFGHMSLDAGLVALILAPEAYLPLRTVGERFHAAEDGMAAADRAFGILERGGLLGNEYAEPDRVACDDAARPGIVIHIRDLTVAGRDGVAPDGLNATVRPGNITVLTGPNGCGKSTTVQVILGLIRPEHGTITVTCPDLPELNREQWWARVGWLPQRPVLIPGTLRENIELLGARVGSPELDAACLATGFDVPAQRPGGWDAEVGVGGTGLSLGQRQRLALARVLASGKPVLLLDEPTAHLDSAAEAAVLRALRARADAGATVLVIGHRPAVLAVADEIVEVCAHVLA